jgi:hypothetical protein
MTDTSADALFRQAAEAEGGLPVSAGARVAHVSSTVESDHVLRIAIDLSGVPDDKRPAVIAELREVVNRAVARALTITPSPIG